MIPLLPGDPRSLAVMEICPGEQECFAIGFGGGEGNEGGEGGEGGEGEGEGEEGEVEEGEEGGRHAGSALQHMPDVHPSHHEGRDPDYCGGA